MISFSKRLRRIVSSTSCESLSRAALPSCLTAKILSLIDLLAIMAGLLSLRTSITLGCRRNATTRSLYAVGGTLLAATAAAAEGAGGPNVV